MISQKHIIIFIVVFFLACNEKRTPPSKVPLIAKDTTKKLEKANNLFVFVGRQIELKRIPYEEGDFNNGFLAKYEILLRVYGYYQRDTIEFYVYDHYGIPAFSKFQNVLLYVSKTDQHYVHEKYIYNDVYKTKDGRWAGSYTYDYSNLVDKNTSIKPVKIAFEDEVYYNITKQDSINGITYPEPYFRIEGSRAKVIYGNYLEDLFTLKKNGTLAYRGLFGDTIPEVKPMEIQDVQLEEITVDSSIHK